MSIHYTFTEQKKENIITNECHANPYSIQCTVPFLPLLYVTMCPALL